MKSIVIPVFNQHDFTHECIRSVLENTTDFELVIIDNGSDPSFKPQFTGFIDCQLIRNETNLGFPVAVNQGIRAAKGDTIVLLNNDVIVTPEWADRLTEWLEPFAIVGPVTNYAAGLQRVTIGTYTSREGLDKEADAWAGDYEGVVENVNFVIGFCMAFRKALFDEIGPFDESLWPCSGEEIDFCLMARSKGYEVGIVHDVYVHHEGSQTFNDLERAGLVEYEAICKRNDAHLAKKWGADFWLKQAIEGGAE